MTQPSAKRDRWAYLADAKAEFDAWDIARVRSGRPARMALGPCPPVLPPQSTSRIYHTGPRKAERTAALIARAAAGETAEQLAGAFALAVKTVERLLREARQRGELPPVPRRTRGQSGPRFRRRPAA